jgi:hypothetical protein
MKLWQVAVVEAVDRLTSKPVEWSYVGGAGWMTAARQNDWIFDGKAGQSCAEKEATIKVLECLD